MIEIEQIPLFLVPTFDKFSRTVRCFLHLKMVEEQKYNLSENIFIYDSEQIQTLYLYK